MARKLGKLDRMGVSESALSDEGLEDIKDAIQDVATTLETFEENRAQAIESFGEAQGHHEEREWEERDSALEEAQSAVDEMSGALDEIESQTDVIKLPDGRLETLRKTVKEVQGHLEALI